MTTATHLECATCGKTYETGQHHCACVCGGPLFVRYDLGRVRQGWNREWIRNGPASIWRYAPVLPVSKPASVVSLGEGMMPLNRLLRLGKRLGAEQFWIKDEGLNPTGSFYARAASCAVSMCVELGITRIALAATPGYASAFAAYAASAGIEAHVFLPRSVPRSAYTECPAFGASVTLISGSLVECERAAQSDARQREAFDVSPLREPYGIEGAKTMGYELAEQMNWELADALVCPAGSGMAIIGLWKAFEELEALGWISSKRPKMIAVEAEGCQPLVRALESGAPQCELFPDPRTLATELCVPQPYASSLLLKLLHASGGTAVAVGDAEILDAGLELASAEGILVAPEGAACLVALQKLLASGVLTKDQKIVVCNTGSGLKHLDLYARRLPKVAASEYDKLGGLITPR